MKWPTVLLAVLTISGAYSGVNLKNGNFYISYTDIQGMTRTYNSKSTEIGWFGVGWGNPFETRLSVGADGSVVIQENGAGAATRFTPKSKVDGKAAAKRIVEAMRGKSSLSGANAKKLIKRLAQDAELRHSYAKQFGVEAKIKKGMKFYSHRRGRQELRKAKKVFFESLPMANRNILMSMAN